MSGQPESRGVLLSAIFEPYHTGTTKARASGIDDAGVELSDEYLNIIYGSPVTLATGIASEGDDLNTLYAKLGTYSPPLPIDGQTFSHAYSVVTGTGNSTIGFKIAGGTNWAVYGSDSAHGPTTLASGTLPANSSKVQFTWGSFTVDNLDSGGATSNSASTPQPIGTDQDAHYTTDNFGSLAATHGRNYTFSIDFYDASSNDISHTVINLLGVIEGSS